MDLLLVGCWCPESLESCSFKGLVTKMLKSWSVIIQRKVSFSPIPGPLILAALIRQSLPYAEESVFDYVVNTLYPAVYDESQPHRNNVDRGMLIASEFFHTYNTDYLARHVEIKRTTISSLFRPVSTPGCAMHLLRWFLRRSSFNATIAMALQEHLASLVQNSMRSGEGLPSFPFYVLPRQYWTSHIWHYHDDGPNSLPGLSVLAEGAVLLVSYRE